MKAAGNRTAGHGGIANRIISLAVSVLALILLAISATYSWFNQGTEIIGKNIFTGVEEVPGIYISVDGGKFSDSLTLNMGSTLLPVCGNGRVFFEAVMGIDGSTSSSGSEIEVLNPVPVGYKKIADGGKSGGIADERLFCTDFTLKAESDADIRIAADSFLLPASVAGEGEEGSSSDYLAGALRAALLQKQTDGSYELKCIWIPNYTFMYSETDMTCTEDGCPESEYVFTDSENGSQTVISCTSAGYEVKDGVIYLWEPGKCREPAASLKADTETSFRLIIWLEGSDRECSDMPNGYKSPSELSLKLSFAADMNRAGG